MVTILLVLKELNPAAFWDLTATQIFDLVFKFLMVALRVVVDTTLYGVREVELLNSPTWYLVIMAPLFVVGTTQVTVKTPFLDDVTGLAMTEATSIGVMGLDT